MTMKNPPHPGELVKHECLEVLNLSVTKAADILGVTRQTLSNVVNCKSGISPDMSVRLSKAFGGTPDIWLKMQMAYDLAQVQKRADTIHVKRFEHV